MAENRALFILLIIAAIIVGFVLFGLQRSRAPEEPGQAAPHALDQS